MKLVTYIESEKELHQYINYNCEKLDGEIVLGCQELSRYSKTTYEELILLTNIALKNKLNIVLEWDALNQEEKFRKALSFFDRLPLHDFKAVRLQDPGAVEYVKTKYPWLKIQLILENGNHNLVGLLKWSEYLGDQCERLILSNELSKEMLKEYAKVLKTPIEVLVLGRILLFYSPRMLLSALEKENMQKSYIEASGSSEESPHTGFPLIENRHGTFMFNVKDLYLLDHFQELQEMNIIHTRVDLRFDGLFEKYFNEIALFFKEEISEGSLGIKKNHLRPMIKGFYNINKTDVLFTKLKNKRTQRNDKNYLGEIVDVERDFQLALLLKNSPLQNLKGTNLKLITPEGKEKIIHLQWVRSSMHEEITNANKNDVILIPYINGVTVKTQVYFLAST